MLVFPCILFVSYQFKHSTILNIWLRYFTLFFVFVLGIACLCLLQHLQFLLLCFLQCSLSLQKFSSRECWWQNSGLYWFLFSNYSNFLQIYNFVGLLYKTSFHEFAETSYVNCTLMQKSKYMSESMNCFFSNENIEHYLLDVRNTLVTY